MTLPTDSSPEIYHLANQLQRINYLGNVQTLQIEFEFIPEERRSDLEEIFVDSTTMGRFKSDMIILEQISGRDMLEIINTLHSINNIFGDLSVIEGVTALVEVNYKNETFFVVVSYNPHTSGLELISTSESKLFLELLNFIRTKWALSKSFIK
ncbi:MAG: hypothetical protein KAS63_08175 [Candidatus Heimdallarchaeota archaeon]|nr:hypothetical protein [Candidatus Heimdallarchaeota archaeon]MCK4955327.1 hypothetical protein [Candidatus Heimdallarchaeota archaeon]